ncbi:hypothetical protein OPV22_002595 [Ensete ventricosum]|uniref:ATP-grasp fold succinyl-CoA synthetase-type domain-containing protein n=1 Tax=Ensete ventricosum TaxID=4639 RepID=A0AAV8RYD0_ENSVE|nr:hypothetical protein OPV22_002595 [Ensete ventricosum]
MMRGSIGELVAGSLAFARRWQKQQLRRLNVHEYQGAELMIKYGINVSKGVAAPSIEEVKEAVKSVFPSGKEVVVKSHILAGGRGLGTFKSGLKGGVHNVKTEEVADFADKGNSTNSFVNVTAPYLEINPIAETSDNQLVAADAKFNFDDNAALRQREIFALQDPSQEDPREVGNGYDGYNRIAWWYTCQFPLCWWKCIRKPGGRSI